MDLSLLLRLSHKIQGVRQLFVLEMLQFLVRIASFLFWEKGHDVLGQGHRKVGVDPLVPDRVPIRREPLLNGQHESRPVG